MEIPEIKWEFKKSSKNNKMLENCLFYILFVCYEVECPSQQFFSHVGTEPMLPGY